MLFSFTTFKDLWLTCHITAIVMPKKNQLLCNANQTIKYRLPSTPTKENRVNFFLSSQFRYFFYILKACDKINPDLLKRTTFVVAISLKFSQVTYYVTVSWTITSLDFLLVEKLIPAVSIIDDIFFCNQIVQTNIYIYLIHKAKFIEGTIMINCCYVKWKDEIGF